MKVSESKICVGCDELFAGDFCPICGRDDNWVWLNSWLPAMKPGCVIVDEDALRRLQDMAGVLE